LITPFLLVIAVFLLVCMALGLMRIVLGPSPSDRMMAAQLLGTSGIALMLLLAHIVLVPALIDAALVLALLAAVAIAAFTRRRAEGVS